MNPTTAQSAWDAAYRQLELQFDRATFDTWIRAASLLRVEPTRADAPMGAGLPASGGRGEQTFVIGVLNSYARDMLQHRLYRNIRRVVSDSYGQLIELQFEIVKAPEAAKPSDLTAGMPLLQLLEDRSAASGETAARTPLHRQIARPQRPDLPEQELNPKYTLDRFLPGNENAMLYAAARAVAESAAAAYNPLYIYGGVGMGKTHLLHAIANSRRARGQKVVYISSEMFTNDMIDAIRQKTTAMFREKYRSADVLLVDDIQFIGGKESTQEEFFHTFNALHTFGKQIVLAGDRHPRELETLADRLRSRFEGGLVMDIHLPELETRVAILRQWSAERGVSLDAAALEVLAARARTNIRELEGVFNQMLMSMQFAQNDKAAPRRAASGARAASAAPQFDAQQVEAALIDYARPRHHVTIMDVIEVTARHFKLNISDLVGLRRSARINEARQIAMYLARELTSASLPQIGEAFGGRKHSTVHHACAAITTELEHDDRVAGVLEVLRVRLIKEQQD